MSVSFVLNFRHVSNLSALYAQRCVATLGYFGWPNVACVAMPRVPAGEQSFAIGGQLSMALGLS